MRATLSHATEAVKMLLQNDADVNAENVDVRVE